MHFSTHTALKRQPALYLLVAVLFSLVLTACGNSDTTTTSAATVAPPTTLLHSGEFVVGSDTTYAPMEYVDAAANGNTGFDIDLITEIGKRMGLKTTIKKTGFDTIFDDLGNKRFDVVISSVTVNSDRQAKFDFVNYFSAGASLLVGKSNPKHLKSTADLCGIAVGVQTGTVEQDALDKANATCKENGKPEIKQTVLQDQTAVIDLLSSHRVDATYQDSPVTDYYNKLNPGQFEIGGSIVDAAPYGITIRKGDTSMSKAIDAAFQSVKKDGTYDKLFDKYSLTKSQKIS